ncbi:MAG: hypothetical protein RBG1_1C00001G1684 [candidate division Zixibacteria bacterium RBG-1]|nr:MAG: hypothetical protein RBG1_1C00001G1684 [candidate division Zixibacteria bacterium RBG-1]OGC84225.1 MAG: hypothetical protein A2V73_07700 [candidate division Zixibacteria bacterium RBG_19FT_COMBO_42_43]
MLLFGIEKIDFISKFNDQKMENNKIIYLLTIEDIQNVAMQELYRKLSAKEIKKIVESIGEKIKWYDAIADSINENIKSKVES